MGLRLAGPGVRGRTHLATSLTTPCCIAFLCGSVARSKAFGVTYGWKTVPRRVFG
jgi:hypothetical protein